MFEKYGMAAGEVEACANDLHEKQSFGHGCVPKPELGNESGTSAVAGAWERVG